jgi:hypothetical protein
MEFLGAGQGALRCVVTGQTPHGIEWHHLDDNPTNDRMGNFLPIVRDYNTALREARKRPGVQHGLPAALIPDNLQAQAQRWHDVCWETGLAYGCARLAVFVARSYFHAGPAQVLRRASDALYFARHRYQPTFIADVLARDVLPNLGESLDQKTRVIILTQLAGLFSDHGHGPDAAALYDKIRRLSPRSALSTDRGYAALLRRQAMTMGATGVHIRQIRPRLIKSSELVVGDANAEVGVSTALAWIYQRDEDWESCIDALEGHYRQYRRQVTSRAEPLGVTSWNLAELFAAYATARAARGKQGDRSAAESAAKLSRRFFSQSGARPYDLWPGHRQRMRGLAGLTELARLDVGIKMPPEVERLANRAATLLSQ